MVDFNSEATITRPAAEVVKITILQRRYEALNEFTVVYQRMQGGGSENLGMAKALLRTLARDLGAMFSNRMKDYQALLRQVASAKKMEDLEQAFDRLDAEIYRMGLTKIDTGRVYDKTMTETENREKGL